MTIHFNQDAFLPLSNGQIVLWNVREHRQFSVDAAHALRLIDLSLKNGRYDKDNALDKNLIESGVVSLDPYPPTTWGWDALARIFHVGTSDIPQPPTPTSAHVWAQHNLQACADIAERPFPAGRNLHQIDKIPLPTPDLAKLDRASLWECCNRRTTCRAFPILRSISAT